MDNEDTQTQELNAQELKTQQQQDAFVIQQLATENANLKIQNIRMGHLLSNLTQKQENV